MGGEVLRPFGRRKADEGGKKGGDLRTPSSRDHRERGGGRENANSRYDGKRDMRKGEKTHAPSILA